MMIRLLVWIVFSANLCLVLANPIKLNEAISQHKITCSIHGNPTSTHYLEPIVLELSNKTNETVNISVENGDFFIPVDTTKQNIVVTTHELIVLQPGQKNKLNIKGMCTEQYDGAGDEQTVYSYQSGKNELLKQLTRFISEKKYQTSAAQYAVWNLMGNGNINDIYAADTLEENNLRQFMAKLTGKTFTTASKNYRTSYYAPAKEKVVGNFEYSFTEAQDVQIAMFDTNGILVRELFNQKKVPAGLHKLNFEYDSSVYTDAIYYFKLIVDNEVMVNRKWDVGVMREHFKQKLEHRD